MKHLSSLSLAAIALATLSACNTLPPEKTPLELARMEHQAARDNPQTATLAPAELQAAEAAMRRANQADAEHASAVTVDHLAYLARQRAQIAQEATRQKAAEARVGEAEATRARMQLEARTREADARAREADAARQSTLTAQEQTRAAELRNRELQEQIKTLNAKPTPRGWVITIGDVLFGTGLATLKSGSARNIDKLADFLQQYPQRTVLIEGFTDSTGGEAMNTALSGRRSEAVREALIRKGVAPGRITTRGYGESYPVADNTSASGRQLNRRVEIILSDDTGVIPPR
ncbi:MAG: OmpA family protein [Hylemonella sp.]|nr:OmpA family protein [Hylemonella sp.]